MSQFNVVIHVSVDMFQFDVVIDVAIDVDVTRQLSSYSFLLMLFSLSNLILSDGCFSKWVAALPLSRILIFLGKCLYYYTNPKCVAMFITDYPILLTSDAILSSPVYLLAGSVCVHRTKHDREMPSDVISCNE